MPRKLTEQEILAIEIALNAKGSPKVEVKIEKNEVVVLKVTKERIC